MVEEKEKEKEKEKRNYGLNMKQVLKSFREVNIDEIEPTPFNPNEQDEATFNELIKNIKEDGFDEPIQIAPKDLEAYRRDPKNYRGGYWIVGGEHRYRAVRLLGEKSIIAVIREWDLETIKVKTVQRNTLRGEIRPEKLTKLVLEMAKGEEKAIEEIRRKMGFFDERKWKAVFRPEDYKKNDIDYTKPYIREILKETDKEITIVENLSTIINQIFSKYGDTVKDSYIFFTYGKKIHLIVSMDMELKSIIDLIIESQKKHKVDINKIMKIAFKKGVWYIKSKLSLEDDEDKEDKKKEKNKSDKKNKRSEENKESKKTKQSKKRKKEKKE